MNENFFGKNLKFMRKRRNRTQDDVSSALDMKRSTVSGYENGIAEPGIQTLLTFSAYYKIPVDVLLKQDLSALSEKETLQLEMGSDEYFTGNKLRILATTVDSSNRENIELVPYKASAGYRAGYADPEFIRVLPTFHMPFLSTERKYRTFQISGDSMLPIPHGSWVTGEFVENWALIQDNQPCIILTLNDGIVFKVVENLIQKERKLTLHSLNSAYDPYSIDVKDICEVWKFVHYISSEMPEPNLPQVQYNQSIEILKKEIRELKAAVQGKLFD